MLKIRKNDIVLVIAGKDKGKTGKVLRVLPAKSRAIVEGINMVRKATRKTREDQQGGIIHRENPISLSNLLVTCPKCSRPHPQHLRNRPGTTHQDARVRIYMYVSSRMAPHLSGIVRFVTLSGLCVSLRYSRSDTSRRVRGNSIRSRYCLEVV